MTITTQPRTKPPPSASRAAIWSIGAVWMLMTFNLLIAVGRFQVNVLTWDQWDLATPLLAGAPAWELFNFQHGPHRQGLAFILTSWIMQLSSWDVRIESLWIGGLLSFSALLGLRLKWKISGRIQFRDTWIVLLILSLGQFETLLFAPNASHSAFPLLLLLVAANAWLSASPWRRSVGAGGLSFCLTFTGFGLVGSASLSLLIVLALTRAAIERDLRALIAAAVGLVLAGAGWVLFFGDYVFAPAVPGFRFPWTPLTDYVRVIWTTLLSTARPSEPGTLTSVIGAVVLFVVLAALVRAAWSTAHASKANSHAEVTLLLLASGVGYVIFIALGRVSLGTDAGAASRYLTLMFPMWLGVGLAFERTPYPVVRTGVVLFLWTLALWPMRHLPGRSLRDWPGTLGVTNGDYSTITSWTSDKARWVQTYLETGDIDRAQTLAGNIVYPNPSATQMAEKLAQLRAQQESFFANGATQSSFLPWLGRRANSSRD